MKKLSNRMSVKKSSTKEGQRELIREHTNKINEIIEYCELLETYIKDHNIWHYTEKPYTAMRSTGDCARCGHNHYTDDYVFCNCCNTNAPQPQPIKPQEDIRVEIIKEIIKWDRTTTQKQAHNLALKILAIVKGE